MVIIDKHKFINDDCLNVLPNIDSKSVDIVVTSPPYNINLKYNTYNDFNKNYLQWTYDWSEHIYRVLKDNGSFFLNIAGKVSNFILPIQVINNLSKLFVIQNQIIWSKSIYIEKTNHTYGHFKPVNSNKYLNNTHEFIFHLTKNGNTKLNRLGIGVSYSDKSNSKRWSSKSNTRCLGNVWHIPYVTKKTKDKHPAMFPVELPLKCIKLHGYNDSTIVMDIFGGHFNTSIAAKQLKINSISIEKDELYYKTGIERFNND